MSTSPLPVWIKALYGAPTFAGAAVAIPILIHMPKFYSDVVLVPVGWIALAIALARALDAITDPAIGWLSDRTKSRWGRRGPWIALGAPLCAISLVALFSPPVALSPSSAGVWFTATFALYFFFHAIYEIPYQGLGLELSGDYHERSSLFSWRMAFIIAGTLVASAAPGVLEGFGVADPRTQMRWVSITYATLLVGLYGALVLWVRERPEFAERGSENPLVPGVRRALRNRPFRILFLTFVIGSLPSAVPALLVPFFTHYVIQPENPAQTLALFLVLYFSAGFVFLPLWVWAARRFGKLEAWLASFGIGIAAGIALFFAGKGDVAYVAILHVFAGLGFGAGGLLVPSMQADVVDYDELHTGKRREAQFAAFWAIVPKFVAIPGAALPIAALASIGYVPNREQTPEVLFGIRVIYALVPAAFSLLSFFLARLYPITEQAHAEIQAALAAHALGEAARDPLTGALLEPVAGRAVDESTGWRMDYFSRSELLGMAQGKSPLARIRVKFAASAALALLAILYAARGIETLDVEPGLGPVIGVVAAGFALTAACFHALRLAPARRLAAEPIASEQIRAHLATLVVPSSLRRAA